MKRTSIFTGTLSILWLAATAVAAVPYVAETGSYTVPVEDPGLRDLAKFKIADVDWNSEGNESHLSYTLPADLTGNDTTRIELAGPKSDETSFRLSGAHGDADCARSAAGISCQVSYRNLGIRSDEVNRYLEKKYGDTDQTWNRQKLAAAFISDPIGVVFYPFK